MMTARAYCAPIRSLYRIFLQRGMFSPEGRMSGKVRQDDEMSSYARTTFWRKSLDRDYSSPYCPCTKSMSMEASPAFT